MIKHETATECTHDLSIVKHVNIWRPNFPNLIEHGIEWHKPRVKHCV